MHKNYSDTGNIGTNGFAILKSIYSAEEMEQVLNSLTNRLENLSPDEAASIRTKEGSVYAARNLLSLFPESQTIWNRPSLTTLLKEVLGDGCGLVRGLYFDKPPEQKWSLPWHKDLTVAVKENQVESNLFACPTRKAGVPHLEAPASVLENMLTLRIHLDRAHAENGALLVIPQSHRSKVDTSENADSEALLISANPGDVLAMRPMLTHCSRSSQDDGHRRIVHLEFASGKQLPDGVRWHRFIPIAD